MPNTRQSSAFDPTSSVMEGLNGLTIRETKLSIIDDFNFMAARQKWAKKTPKYKEKRAEYATNEFETLFGGSGDGSGISSNLQGWKALCLALGVEPIPPMPSSTEQCKKVSYISLLEGTLNHRRKRQYWFGV